MFHGVQIPSQLQIKKAWIARLKRTNLPPLKNCYVCSEHFEEDCFEAGTQLKKELFGNRSRRRLKPNAVPTVPTVPTNFLFSASSRPRTKRSASEKRIKRRQHEEVTHLQNAAMLLSQPHVNPNNRVMNRGVETILKVEGHDCYEVKNGGPGVYPRKKFCKPRPSNCRKMIPRLVIMLKPNKIPRLKLYIAITFCLITFLLKSPQ